MFIVYLLPHNSQQQLDLYTASQSGDVRRVTEVLKEVASIINWRDSLGRTALHTACINNRAEVVKVLLKHNSIINQQTDGGNTPLHYACWSGSTDCIKLLLATGQCDLG